MVPACLNKSLGRDSAVPWRENPGLTPSLASLESGVAASAGASTVEVAEVSAFSRLQPRGWRTGPAFGHRRLRRSPARRRSVPVGLDSSVKQLQQDNAAAVADAVARSA